MQLEISAPDLAARLQAALPSKPTTTNTDQETFLLLDVREPWEVETASIAGSLNVPMGDLPSRAHQELDPDAHIVVYCHHGRRSLSVVYWLREQGFEHTQSLAGGIDGWSAQIDPSVPQY